MRNFVSSLSSESAEAIWAALAEVWPRRINDYELGPYVCLLWDRASRDAGGAEAVFRRLTAKSDEAHHDLNDITLRDIDLSQLASDEGACLLNLAKSVLADCLMENTVFDGSSFESAVLDNVSFRGSSLRNCNFRSAFLFECDLTETDVTDANFQRMDNDSTFSILNAAGSRVILSGSDARGFLKWQGALVDEVEAYHIYQFHPKFGIIFKILEQISGQRNSQKRGLTQRGEAQNDPPFARSFLDYIESNGWITINKNELVSATPLGRTEVSKIATRKNLPSILVDYLEAHS